MICDINSGLLCAVSYGPFLNIDLHYFLNLINLITIPKFNEFFSLLEDGNVLWGSDCSQVSEPHQLRSNFWLQSLPLLSPSPLPLESKVALQSQKQNCSILRSLCCGKMCCTCPITLFSHDYQHHSMLA